MNLNQLRELRQKLEAAEKAPLEVWQLAILDVLLQRLQAGRVILRSDPRPGWLAMLAVTINIEEYRRAAGQPSPNLKETP